MSTPERLTKKAFKPIVAGIFHPLDRALCKAYARTGSIKIKAVPGLVFPGEKSARIPVEWNGFHIEVQILLRGRVVCGVPFPHSTMEFWYALCNADGVTVASGKGIPEFTDNVFRHLARAAETV